MSPNKEKRAKQIDEVSEMIKASSTVCVVDYAGMDVAKLQELKKALKEVDSKLFIIKNTLFALAAEKAKSPEEVTDKATLAGPSAYIFTEGDPIAPIQVLGKFAKSSDLPQFKVGIVEGSFQDKNGMIALSKLPGKEVLVGQAMGAIAAPLYGFVSTLNAPMQKLVYVLSEASKKEL